jgi:phosphate starvation-inducible membrane PsiE
MPKIYQHQKNLSKNLSQNVISSLKQMKKFSKPENLLNYFYYFNLNFLILLHYFHLKIIPKMLENGFSINI